MSSGSRASAELMIRIRKIVRAIHLESKKIQKDYGVSIPQLLCLQYLDSKEDKQAKLKEAASFLHLNSSTVSGIIDRLEARALAVRLPKQGDRRTTLIALTSKGEKVLKSTPTLLQDRLNQHLLSASESDIAAQIAALDQIIAMLGIENVEAAPMLAAQSDLGKDGEEERY